MSQQIWEPTRRIEENYKRTLQQITDIIDISIQGITDPFEIVSRIKNIVSKSEYLRYAEASAMKMVTQLFNDSGRTWRQAARKNSKGRTIYEALRHELTGRTGGEVAHQIRRNAEIIKTLPRDIARQVTEHIADESFKGRRASDIADDIRRMFPGQSKAKASLIARTEVSKTSTALTQSRAEDIGADWYVWETSQDQRVRSSHNHMQNVLIAWREPPSPEQLIGIKGLGHYHAGCIFNCRCYPAPLLSLDDVSWPHKVYLNGSIRTLTRSQFKELSMGIQNVATAKPEPKVEEVKKEFAPAKSTKEAEDYSRNNLKVKNVNLSDFYLDAANDINKHFSMLQEKYPEVFVMQKLSSGQTLFKDVYNKEIEDTIEKFVKMGYNRSRAEELAARTVKHRKMPATRIAQSNSVKNEFNGISFNQKYYKTAKGYGELKEISKKQAEIGFWSHGGINGTITHEFGHQVMDYLEDNHLGTFIHNTFKQLRAEVLETKTGLKGYRELLSEYGGSTVYEFFAEAFREYIESDNPRKYARMIGEMTEQAFKNLRGRR